MDRKEILKKRKQNILESYELDSQLAPCIKSFKRDKDSIDFETKEHFNCGECLSDICFKKIEKGDVKIIDPMFV